jgi:hypothetical protein
MNTTDQKFGAWSGPIFAAFLGAALIVPGFFPLPSPQLSIDEVAAIYQGRTGLIRIGVVLAFIGITFVVPFAAVISTQMRRMQGISRMAIYLQLGAGAAGAIVVLLPFLVIGIASFRPERDPQLTMMLNDAAWLGFITVFPLAVAQNLGLAIGTLMDTSAKPVFPRWVGYFNLWVALLFVPAVLAFFLKSGPFAWDGLISFWVAACAFFGWLLVMTFVLLKAIGESETAT